MSSWPWQDVDALALTFAGPVMPREPAWLDASRYERRRRPRTEDEEYEDICRDDGYPYDRW
jgi:hypothetical protein